MTELRDLKSQILIQDDLTELDTLRVKAQGHIEG